MNVPPSSLGSLGGVDGDVAGVLLGGMEEAGLLARGYDLWGEVEVRRVEEEPGELREEISKVHAALPGEGTVSLPELARKAGVRPVVAQSALFRLMVDGLVDATPRGSLADIRLKTGGLDDESRGAIASRLKSRTRAAYDQIRTVETYTTLSTCRREHLLRHFGDTEEVAPCAGCDVCLGEAHAADAGASWDTSSAPLPGGAPLANGAPIAEIDGELFERLRGWRGEQARSQGVPAYVVLHNSHLEEISRRKPRNVHELGTIKGIGLRRAARYGEEILALINGGGTKALAEDAQPEPVPVEGAPEEGR
ncbi:hypothetical protein GBA65_12030 [Rubrobacter marinus]|uniref:HRDC domain-containing protein n=1 Tax=Rubrobacter marinus TaxID=2653852 RepID=A0A6G8PY47_9ACTN|nr:HRDC domain-containing protein [Rubrobacter marinus]QIN79131.1 hypothetical protein GBA65_12030 [Rubrobacter marinus]